MKLGTKIKLVGGGTPNKEIDEYWNGGIAWASIKDFKSEIISKTVDKISLIGLENSVARIVKKGTLLIATRMAVGKTAIAGIDLAFNQDIKAIQHSEDIETKFLHYFLKSKQAYFESISSGATVKGIKIQDILNIQIPLPSLEEQKRIATLLDKADELRQKDKALLQKYDALAQSLFLEMFGDPVKNEKGWEKKKLSEITEITSSRRIFKNEYIAKGIPFFRTKEIVELSKEVNIKTELFISEERYAEIKLTNEVPVVGDILMSAVGTIGVMWVVNTNKPFYFKDGNLVWLKVSKSNQINPIYLKMTLEYLISAEKEKLSQGAAYNALTIDKLKQFNFYSAPLKRQNQFAEQIKLIEAQKLLVQQNLVKSEGLFLGLLGESFK